MDLDELAQSISDLRDHPAVQHQLHLVSAWKENEWTVLYILLALAVGFAIGRYRAHRVYRAHCSAGFQNHGEVLLTRALLQIFAPPDYHLMNHVTLQMGDGTTQIDHILVSRFGVFVIETKDYKGWIFGSAKDANWTQVLFRGKFRFQNPICQNFRHVRAVEGLLDFLPSGAVKSVVVFTGASEFKTEIPEGVFTLSGIIEFLRDQTVELMSLNRVQFCVGRLEAARLAISDQTDVEHARSLQRRRGGAG